MQARNPAYLGPALPPLDPWDAPPTSPAATSRWKSASNAAHRQVDRVGLMATQGHAEAGWHEALLSKAAKAKRAWYRVAWSSPRRRLASVVCLVILVLVFYVVGRAVDAKNIVNSTPALSKVRVANLCSQGIQVDLEVTVFNPSNAFATLRAMTSSLVFNNKGNATASQGVVCGYINTPDVSISPGHQSINLTVLVNISTDALPGFQLAFQAYLNNQPVDLTANIPLVASFPSSMFLVPITLSLPLVVDFVVPALNSSTAPVFPATPSPTVHEYEAAHIVKGVEMLHSVDPTNWAFFALHLNLLPRSLLVDSVFDVDVPPLTFALLANQRSVATVQNDYVYLGRTASPINPSNDATVSFRSATTNKDIQGFQYAFDRIIGGYPIDLLVCFRASSTADFNVTYDHNNSTQVCWLQQMLQGITYSATLNVGSLASTPGIGRRALSSVPADLPSSISLNAIAVQTVNASGALIEIGLDLQDLGVNVYGAFPAMDFIVQGFNSSSVPLNSSVLLALQAAEFQFDLANFVMPLTLQVVDPGTTIGLVYSYTQGVYAFVQVRTNPNSAMFWPRLMSSIKVDVDVARLLSQAPLPLTIITTPSSSRRTFATSPKQITANLTSFTNNVTLAMAAWGFDDSFWGGAHVTSGSLYLEVKAKPNSTASMQTIATFALSAYDSEKTATPLTVQLGVADPVSTQGNYILQVFRQLLNGTNMSFQVTGIYNDAAALSRFGGPMELQLGTFNASSNATNTTSIFQQLGVTLNSTALSYQLGTHLEFNATFIPTVANPSLGLSLNLPEISIGVIECGYPTYEFLDLGMMPWTLSNGAPSSLALFNGTIVDQATALSLAAESVIYYIDICIVPLAMPPDLLSALVGSLNASFLVSATSSSSFETVVVNGFANALG